MFVLVLLIGEIVLLVVNLYCFLLDCIKLISSHKTTNSQMESYVELEEEGLFYMGAQTVWLPAEHFIDINNWDDSLKQSASYYIKQVEEWIASKENESRNVANLEQGNDATKSVIITKPTPNGDVDVSSHSKRHAGGRAKYFACTVCGKKLASKWTLNHHLLIHSGKKPFACSQCGKAFALKSNLTQHNRIHSGEKPFTCNQCEKAFGNGNNLTRHLRVHSGEKPFMCEKCGKSFTQSRHRNNHVKQCKVSVTVV